MDREKWEHLQALFERRILLQMVPYLPKGGVTTQAKDHFDKMLDSVRRKANKTGNS